MTLTELQTARETFKAEHGYGMTQFFVPVEHLPEALARARVGDGISIVRESGSMDWSHYLRVEQVKG